MDILRLKNVFQILIFGRQSVNCFPKSGPKLCLFYSVYPCFAEISRRPGAPNLADSPANIFDTWTTWSANSECKSQKGPWGFFVYTFPDLP